MASELNNPSADNFTLFQNTGSKSSLEQSSIIDNAVANVQAVANQAGQIMTAELQANRTQGAMYLAETARAVTNTANAVLSTSGKSFGNAPSSTHNNNQPAHQTPRLK